MSLTHAFSFLYRAKIPKQYHCFKITFKHKAGYNKFWIIS